MSKNFVIVESPAKAKTIEQYLGSDFVVRASMGHIRDLPKDDKAIDVQRGFEPYYEITEGKDKLINELKRLANSSEMVWLATDEDREGEAIAWHLYEALELHNKPVKRIVYHEITKKAINEAIQNPRDINIDLVNAQQARRLLDRLVGFELSPLLWKKIKPSLSAGRVQSVAVRLIVEREKEIRSFETSSTFRIQAQMLVNGDPTKGFTAELPTRFASLEEAMNFVQGCLGARYTISNVETRPGKKSPSAPFTTSTLQQEASRKLGYSIASTMQIAQKLYEAGHITYMRTDSVNLSQQAIEMAQQQIIAAFGERYSKPQQYTTKSSSAQEAHEAIRPTDFSKKAIEGDKQAQKLYELIWKRTLASQMSDAQLEKTTATIAISTQSDSLIATGEVLKFDGFLKLYLESTDDEKESADDEKMLPPMTIGDNAVLEVMTATERYAKPPARYTEATLVKKMEELGIGRPSTYAPTISTIQKRDYVLKEDRDPQERIINVITLLADTVTSTQKKEKFGAEKSKLFPTDIGIVVTDFLIENFGQIMDYNFTATVEEQFDQIAEGKVEWRTMLGDFYNPFHSTIEETAQTAVKSTPVRVVGTDPSTGNTIFAKIGRYGPMVQIGDNNSESVRFASIPSGLSIETIDLDAALNLFKLPRLVGQFENEDVTAALGKFGPYLKHKNKFFNLYESDDVMTIDIARAIELIESKREREQQALIKEFPDNPDVKIKKGRYGPYISIGSISVRIPRGEQPESITLQRCFELMREQGKEVLDKKTKDKKSDEIDPKSIIREFEKYPSVKIINGRFGVYAMVGKKNIRLPKEIDIHTVSAEKIIALQIEQEAKEPVKSKKKEEKIASINIIRHFPLNPNVKICNGPKGPYVLVGKDEVKIPASTNPTMMSLEQCLSLHRLHVMDKARKAAKKATKPKK